MLLLAQVPVGLLGSHLGYKVSMLYRSASCKVIRYVLKVVC